MRPAALFDTVAIAGVGLIGGSVGLGIHQRFLANRIIGLDPNPTALEAARGLGVIDEAHLAPGPWLASVELLILASPVRTLVPLGRSLEPHLAESTIITDVGSVKSEVVRGLGHLRFIGGHPMAGSEKIGVQNADPALLENAVWVLTPCDTTDPTALERTIDFVNHLGANPITTTPEQHDRLVAAVSHVPYLTALALTQLITQDRDHDLMTLLAAGGFRDLTRIASGNPRVSRDMVIGNQQAVHEALKNFKQRLDKLIPLLDEPDRLLEQAEAAKRSRDSFPIVRRTLLPARYEFVIAVPDRPGELARITRALGDAQVNIKDIEVLGIREAGGAVRLAFDHEEGMRRGSEALRREGYEVRLRGG